MSARRDWKGWSGVALALASALLLASTAWGAGPDDEEPPPPDDLTFVPATEATTGVATSAIRLGAGSVEPHPGEYWGVVPGSTRPAPGSPTAKPGGVQKLAWIGFQMMDSGGSRVYLVTTNPVTHVIKDTTESKIIIEVSKTRAMLRNHLRDIDTTFFHSYVSRIKAKAMPGARIRLEIKLRAPVMPTVERVGDFLFLEFPPPAFSTDS